MLLQLELPVAHTVGHAMHSEQSVCPPDSIMYKSHSHHPNKRSPGQIPPTPPPEPLQIKPNNAEPQTPKAGTSQQAAAWVNLVARGHNK